MNTIVATLFLILAFTVNGSALDEQNSNVDSPLMMFSERSGETGDPNKKSPNQESQEQEAQLRNPDVNNRNNAARGTQLTPKDPTISISSSSDQDQELEDAHNQLKLAYENLQKTATTSESLSAPILILPDNPENSLIGHTDEAVIKAMEGYIQCLRNLNALEKARGLPATSPHSNLSTPPEKYNTPVPLSPNGRTPIHPSVIKSARSQPRVAFKEDSTSAFKKSSSSVLSTQTSLTVHIPSTSPNRAPSVWWPHRDSWHPIQLIPNVLGDTPVSAFIVWHWFDIAPKYAITSWLVANVGVSLAVSPHVTRLIEARSPLGGRLMRTLTTPNDVWNPVYFTYYSIAWGIMGMDKTFNVTPVQAMGFMLVSGMIRQVGAAVIRQRPCFSWDRGNVWNKENLDKLAAGPRNQTLRIIDRWVPDVFPGALARSATRNIYRWHEGESPITAVWPGAKQNMILYTAGLVGYYAGYRLLEHFSHPLYREKAAMDQEDLQKLYSNIHQVAQHGLALPDETVGERGRLLANAKATISKEALKASLDVLNSSYINLFKDPLLFRNEITQAFLWSLGINHPETPAAFKEAYRIIDLLDIYKGHVSASATTPEQIKIASNDFLHTLNRNLHGDVENNLSPGNFDPLIKLYVPYSKFDPTLNNSQNVEMNPLQESLLRRAVRGLQLKTQQQRQNGYGAVEEDDHFEEENHFRQIELSPLGQQKPFNPLIQDSNVSSSKDTATTESSKTWFSYHNSEDSP